MYHENMRRGTPGFPLSLYCVDSTHPRYQMLAHWHNDFEIVRVLKGRLSMRVGGITVELESGDSIIIPGNILHGAEAFSCRYECIVFSKTVFSATVESNTFAESLTKPSVYHKNAEVDAIFDGLAKKENGYALDLIGRIYCLVANSLRADNKIPIMSNASIQRIKPALALIAAQYAEKITLEQMAEACNMSRNYFSKYFKEITQETPFSYLMAYRIEAACELLASGAEYMTEVCFRCGFNDLSYFIHVFKRYKGCAPKKYVKKLKEKD